MPKFPEPPARLAVPAVTRVLPSGTLLWRVYFRGGTHPTSWSGFRFFGPAHGRFDAALEPLTCLAEAFQATRVIERAPREPWLAGFELTRDVALLDLTGTWPTKAGASMAIGSGPRPRAQRWSKLIYASFARVEGLLYSSSMHANKPAVALCERCQNALPAAPKFNRALADAALRSRLNHAASELGYRLV